MLWRHSSFDLILINALTLSNLISNSQAFALIPLKGKAFTTSAPFNTDSQNKITSFHLAQTGNDENEMKNVKRLEMKDEDPYLMIGQSVLEISNSDSDDDNDIDVDVDVDVDMPLSEDDPYELIIDSLIQENDPDKNMEKEDTIDENASFVDGLLLSDLLAEMFGAESVVTTKAFQSDYAKQEIKEEAKMHDKLLDDLVKLQQSSLSKDIFDEPDVDYSRELSENMGSIPSTSINIESKLLNTKKRKVWGHAQIVARMPPTSQTFISPEMIIASLEDTLGLSENNQSLQYEVQPINTEKEEDMDWCKQVQKTWPPSLLSDDILITLPFHTEEDCVETLQKSSDSPYTEENPISYDRIWIEGGSAFGTGDHPTSRMCSEWLLRECQINEESDDLLRVMDYGSGSGILAFVALLSAKRQNLLDQIRADGVEVDTIAIESARRNAVLNDFTLASKKNFNVPGVQFYGPMEGTPGSDLWDAITGIACVDDENEDDDDSIPNALLPKSRIGTYDILIANILAQPLIALVKTIAMLMKPGVGRLALSGLVLDQVDAVLTTYKPYFDDIKVVENTKGWVLLEGTRNNFPSGHPLDPMK